MATAGSRYLDRVNALSPIKKRLLLERLRSLDGAHHTPTGGGRLLAFVKRAPGVDMDITELRAYCDDKLPAYMVPQVFSEIDAVPTTTAGKIDRRALQVFNWMSVNVATGTDRGDADGAPRDAIEEKLAEIWCAVLGVDEISIYDNFFEVGGDSLQIIRILSRASKEGLNIKPDVIFSHPTIAEQAQFATVASIVKTDAGVTTGLLPLMPIQHWFFERINRDPHHWNQSLLFQLPTVDTTILERAVQKILSHHDALRSCFTTHDGTWRAEILDIDANLPLRRVDMTNLPSDDHRTTIERTANELHGTLDLGAAPLMRIAHFHTIPSLSDYVLIIAHHLIVDAESWRILIGDLQTVLSQLLQQQPIELPAKTSSLAAWSKRLGEYANSPACDTQKQYWRAAIAHEYVDIPNDRDSTKLSSVESDSEASEGESRSITVTLEQAVTDQLLRSAPKSLHTRVNVILVSVLARLLARWEDTPGVMFDMEGHGREPLFEDLDVARTVGWFTTVFPVVFRAENASDWQDSVTALRIVKQQLLSVPLNGLGYGLMKELSDDGMIAAALNDAPRSQVLFNYLGQMDQRHDESHQLRLIDDRCGMARSTQCQRAYRLEINALIADGRLRVDWTYSRGFHREDTITALAQQFIDALKELITNADSATTQVMTPADFPLAGLNQDELDNLSAQLGDLDED